MGIISWIFEGIADWIASVMTGLMDAISGIFLNALGTDMTAMEEYFPFITKAFTVMQYTAYAILFLITIWQLFRAFGGPITESENPWQLLARSCIFAVMIGFAKPIFMLALDIARAPYTALLNTTMNAEDFTFAGVQNVLVNALATLIEDVTVVALLLQIILMIALGWNYFKLLLEAVERYIVVGVLCYTSPLAYAMGGSKATNKVFQSWCRMIGSQLLLLVMNVWFLRAFNTSVGEFTANGGALANGQGNIYLWMFCALAFLKTAQKFDSYLASLGLSVAQTGSSMGMELLMGMRMLSGVTGGMKRAGSMFGGSSSGGAGMAAGAAGAGGIMASLANKFKGNSYVRDAVTEGGTRIGAGGSIGLVGRAFGGLAARNGAELTGDSISSVAARPPYVSGSIAGEIADKSLKNYMPHLAGAGAAGGLAENAAAMSPGTLNLDGSGMPGSPISYSGTEISGGHISTTATLADGRQAAVDLYNTSQFETPSSPYSLVTASDGSQWYQMASGAGMGAFYATPQFTGSASEMSQIAAEFPSAPAGTTLRTVGDGVLEAGSPDGGNSLWYNSAYFQEPDAPHDTIQSSDGAVWYAMQPNAATPDFEPEPIQTAGGAYAGSFETPYFTGSASEAAQVAAEFPGTAAGTTLRTVDDGILEANNPAVGSSRWFSSALYQEPEAAHDTIQSADGTGWYAMRPNAAGPDYAPEPLQPAAGDPYAPYGAYGTDGGSLGKAVSDYNRNQFQNFMPGYELPISQVNASRREDGMIEVRHAGGSGTAFYDKTMYQAPRGDYKVYGDSRGGQWYAVPGTPAVTRRPVYENGKPVYDGDKLRTVNVESVQYKASLTRYDGLKKRDVHDRKAPRAKRR